MENNRVLDNSIYLDSLKLIASNICLEYSKKFGRYITLEIPDASKITYFANSKIIYPEIVIRIIEADGDNNQLYKYGSDITNDIIGKTENRYPGIYYIYDIRSIHYGTYLDIILSSKLN